MQRNIKPYGTTLIFLLLFIPCFVFGQMRESVFSFGEIKEIHKFEPLQPGDYPVIVFGHGLRSCWSCDSGGLGNLLKNGLVIPYVVYCIQNPYNDGEYRKSTISAIKDLVDDYEIRIITGLSQGGILCASALNYQGEFWYAAGIMSGKTSLTDYERFKNVHIRAWHNSSDPVVGNSIFKFITGMQGVGADATLIKYSDTGHNSWRRGYSPSDPDGFLKWIEGIIPKEPEPPQPSADTVLAQWIERIKYPASSDSIDVMKVKTFTGKTYIVNVNPLE